jgi:hypothetical protein
LRKTSIFGRKLAKTTENDHNIDPRLDEVSPCGQFFDMGQFGKITEAVKIVAVLFSTVQAAF